MKKHEVKFPIDTKAHFLLQADNLTIVIERLRPWDWDEIGIKLGTKHVTYQKLVNFM